MKIKVTQSDIDNGEGGSCVACPIAIAIRRSVRSKIKAVRVQKEYFSLNDGFYDLPQEAQSFISEFDQQRAVKPFEFNIKLR